MPDLLVEIDAAKRFSWALLTRPPQSEHELILLYAALTAFGSDLTAADMARLTLDIEADAVGEMMRRIEGNDRLPVANRLAADKVDEVRNTLHELQHSADQRVFSSTQWMHRSPTARSPENVTKLAKCSLFNRISPFRQHRPRKLLTI